MSWKSQVNPWPSKGHYGQMPLRAVLQKLIVVPSKMQNLPHAIGPGSLKILQLQQNYHQFKIEI